MWAAHGYHAWLKPKAIQEEPDMQTEEGQKGMVELFSPS